VSYKIGTDIGGTCTDSVVLDDDGQIYVGKDLSTYPDFSDGIFNSLADATAELDIGVEELIQETSLFFHATTVGENTLFERDGAKTGLITTKGFEETLSSTRGAYGRWAGLSSDEAKDLIHTDRPEPLVPMDRIEGISERAFRDKIIKPLDEDEVIDALDSFADDLDAIACCFLWSSHSDEHELAVKRIIEEEYPELYVSISSEISPTMGEYERTSTTTINSYIGPTTEQYLDSLQAELTELGFDGTMLLMLSHGGVVSKESATEQPVGLIESGPVGGLLGSRFVSNKMGVENIISTDMGGTTFKTGVINNNRLEYADEPLVGRLHYQFPKRDIHSIAVAGGSIISFEEGTNIPTVGPQSAGSEPGPVCYGRGGMQPTVTDVDLIQGYFSPDYFLGGKKEMDPDLAFEVFEEKIAEPMGKEPVKAAADIYKLINSMIADLLHEITIEKGIDPREFTLVAIGGAAGMHAASYARELDIPEVLVPYTASVNSALGLLSTDVTHEYTEANQLEPPFDLDQINSSFESLEETAREKLAEEGFQPEEVVLDRSISMRYQRQVHEVQTQIETEGPLDESDLETVVDRFETLYQRRYGEGSVYRSSGIEMTDFHVRAIGPLSTPEPYEHDLVDSSASAAQVDTNDVYFESTNGFTETPIYDFEALQPGNVIDGPGIILTPVTSIVVTPEDRAEMDAYRNIRIKIES
jgi:N-methylhydantoinase A